MSVERGRAGPRALGPALAAGMLVLALRAAPSSDQVARAVGLRTAAVRVGAAPTGRALAADAVGLGVEASILRESELTAGHPVLARLLRNLGPGSLRVGGNSLDRPGPAPAAPSAGALASLFALLRPLGWSLLLGIDLGRFAPAAAGDEAATAARLGGGALDAVAFGNEPDLFADRRAGIPAVRAGGYEVTQYLREWRAYAHAARNVPLAGPDVFDTPLGLRMLRALAVGGGPRLRVATAHYYPLSRAVRDPASPEHADLAHLLAPATRARESGALEALVAAAGRRPLRLDEVNSVVGFGKHGVSDTLAGALWTVDFVMRAERAGAVGVNLETSLDRCGSYTPICARSPSDARADRLRVQPNYYALLLVHLAAVGRILPVRVSGDPDLTAYATSGAGRVRIVLDNLRASPVRVRLFLPVDGGRARVLRLQGPSLAATGGATLAGRAVAPDGRWRPGPGEPLALAPSGAVAVAMGGASAALVDARAAPAGRP
jgi:hypothetical protein